MNELGSEALLTGVKVLDLCHFLAGPYATSIMAHLGAEVIKLEDPAHPDEARRIAPFLGDGTSLYFAALNSGKRSVGLRLSEPSSRSVVKRLVGWADVVVSNYRPGVLKKLGFDHDDLASFNPAVISCSITAFGESGPYAEQPGYDYTIQALSGVMALAAASNSEPQRAGVSYIDHSAGLTAALAVSAALYRRERTGHGAHLDVSLLDVQISMLSYLAAWELNSDTTPQPTVHGAHPRLVPAQTFRADDGYLSLFVGNDGMWRRLAVALGETRLLGDDLATNEGRFARRDEVLAILADRFRTRSVAEWVSVMHDAKVACAPVNSLTAALADAQVRHRAVVRPVGSGSAAYSYPGSPLPRLESADACRPVEPLGASTREILRQVGFSASEISRLVDLGTAAAAQDTAPPA